MHRGSGTNKAIDLYGIKVVEIIHDCSPPVFILALALTLALGLGFLLVVDAAGIFACTSPVSNSSFETGLGSGVETVISNSFTPFVLFFLYISFMLSHSVKASTSITFSANTSAASL